MLLSMGAQPVIEYFLCCVYIYIVFYNPPQEVKRKQIKM
jgi:type II secretory pathway component PulM